MSNKTIRGEMQQREFQHLENDDAAPDAQAMGAAPEEDVKPIDDAMAIDEEREDPELKVVPEVEKPVEQENDTTDIEEEESEMQETSGAKDADDSRPSGPSKKGDANRDASPTRLSDISDAGSPEADIEETSVQLSSTHLDSTPSMPLSEAINFWLSLQNKTNSLSQALTSQLRLILTPSLSTKLSGAFRTGKRLNIKRIIPYIASGYKRDKIWMRRAVPTKRAYQVLLCVDDSASMGQHNMGDFALESLVMVSRALTTLEVGQVGVMGFGERIFVAHDLTAPLNPTSGGQILQQFSFSQNETSVATLLAQTISHFRTARLQSSSSSSSSQDLWQLSIILSDGTFPLTTWESVRRLLRQAFEERIMCVFVILDDPKRKGKGSEKNSIMNMLEVVQSEDGKISFKRYMDGFPFRYYLAVREVEELPNLLAGVLRSWFAEVNGGS